MIQKTLLCAVLVVAVSAGPNQAQLPGGRIAYFSAVFGRTPILSGTICVMDLDGGNRVRVSEVVGPGTSTTKAPPGHPKALSPTQMPPSSAGVGPLAQGCGPGSLPFASEFPP